MSAPLHNSYELLARLVAEAAELDQLLAEAAGELEAKHLAEVMEAKRRVTQALFALVPEALKAYPDRRDEILAMLAKLQSSHLRATTALARARDEVGQRLREGGGRQGVVPRPATWVLRRAS
jgi:hypothetical protein